MTLSATGRETSWRGSVGEGREGNREREERGSSGEGGKERGWRRTEKEGDAARSHEALNATAGEMKRKGSC